jgi:hypothetical protein
MLARSWLALMLAASAASGTAIADDRAALAKLFGDLRPGTVVEVPQGRYSLNGNLTLRGARGTGEAPVTIRAAVRGRTVIAGAAGFVLSDCEHVVLEGFRFENDADQQCVRMDNCRHVRVTRNVFRPLERSKPRHWEHWVEVNGERSGQNRIDHNLFDRKVNRGSPLFIRGSDQALVCSQHDRIDHNHFRDVVYANRENGHETIRTGGNDLGAAGKSSFTIIEDNLLERCSGEDECLSLKSSDNIVRRNTLINCRGAICMRLGNRNAAEDNVIMATEDGDGFGGIKLFGFEHRVAGNYFSGLTGSKHEAPFSLFPGLYDTPTTEKIRDQYDDNSASAATRCEISNNTWIDCAPLQLGLERPDKSWTRLPTANVFQGNVLVRTKRQDKPLVNAGMMRDFVFAGNLAYEPGAARELPWAAWFDWPEHRPDVRPPKPLTAVDVGPEAP